MPAACANSVVVCDTMPPPSQIAKGNASPFFRNLPRASDPRLLHNAHMDTEAKNGGPNYLRAWREHRKISQEKLAEMVGTTAGVISHLEAGERGLSAKWLRRLAPALNTTPGFLLDHDPEELPSDVFEMWSSIPDSQKPTARRVLESFRTGTDD